MTVERSSAQRIPWMEAVPLMACVLAVVSMFELIRSLLAMMYLNLRFLEEVDPFSRAVSYYVFVERGSAVFAATLTGVAVATAAILGGMAHLRVRLGAAAVSLFGLWCLALVLCALFPTDNSPQVETTPGLIHQFAGASLFASLPLGGIALARTLATQPAWAGTARVVRRLAIGSVVLALGYLVARVPDLLPWFTFPSALDLRPVSGLVQRALFLLELAILFVLAVRLVDVSLPRRRADARTVAGEAVPAESAVAR